MPDLHPEDAKLVTLARSARARTRAAQGAAVRDTDGRTYVAATVALPKVPFFTARLASCRVATAWLPGHRKKAGDTVVTVAVTATLVPLGVSTVTGTGPAPTSGACTLI